MRILNGEFGVILLSLCTWAMWLSRTDALMSTRREVLQFAKDDLHARQAVQTLMEFKTSIRDDPNDVMVGWRPEDPHPCGWRGVACDPKSIAPMVIAVEIPNQQLEGLIPPGLRNLLSLQRLDLSGNRFTGSIPRELTNFTSLQVLALSANNLTGGIPTEIGQLTSLQTLLLDNNKLGGSIPDTIGRLSELEILDLADNQLEGSIPESLSSCRKLKRLGLQQNELVGKIPPSMGLLTNVEILNLHDNHLTGEIPVQLGSLQRLIVLDAAHNNLTGLIPESIGQLMSLRVLSLGDNLFDVQEVPSWLSNLDKLVELHFFLMNLTGDLIPLLVDLPELEVIDCWGNLLSGIIPPLIGNLRNLTTLDLTANQLTGGIPYEIGLLTKLRDLHLWGTNIGGRFPTSMGNLTSLVEMVIEEAQIIGRIPAEFGQLKNLRRLCVSNNKLEGPVPDELSNLTNLVHLRASGNFLTGKLTVSFRKMRNLNRLDLSSNVLEGFLPTSLVDCPLYLLNLSSNHFQGEIPALYANLSSLQMLYLDGNRLTGRIPSELMSCTMLGDIRLASNLLSGPIPGNIGLLRWLYYLYLQDNHLTGEIPLNLSQCLNLADLNLARNELTGPITGKGFGSFSESMNVLDLADNKLWGIIPPELGQLRKLQVLDLSSNKFTGTIPATLGADKALQRLDLSNNNFQGGIPSSLGQLTDLVSLDLSKNDLTGPIPSTGIFLRFPASAYSGNSKLCGEILRRQCSGKCSCLSCKKVWIPVVTTVLAALLVALGVFVSWAMPFLGGSSRRAGERRRKFNADEFSPLRPPGRFTAQDLVVATNNYYDILGQGERGVVYRGYLPDVGRSGEVPVAMKVLRMMGHRHDAKYMSEIVGEVQTLLKVRHKNIVKILGYCYDKNVVALMMELMPNGTLADHLHKQNGQKLSWKMRLEVAASVASGLVYLHHEAQEQVIHCDLKPSNILLDRSFQAQISDFGISRLTDRDQDGFSISCLRGTRGYIPPEYASSPRVSTKGDVYSYGVILLELLTAKQPLDRQFLDEGHELSGIVSWVADNSSYDFKAVVDSRLLQEADSTSLIQMKMLLDISKMCTQENPKDRPDMRCVMDMLMRIEEVSTTVN
ncbi:hypothetical protein R1flu_026134 [Riccia fluitans]|uniref:non-specific serine/threonine protein kinase n=1 Tax=Riccia fluitans TaxID=41844 RepID=A0ABD1XI14_9MARC